MTRRHARPARRRVHSLYAWHRYVGAAAAAVVAVVAVTGIMLNHTETLRLDERRLHAAWLLDRYGIAPPATATRLRAGDATLVQLEGRLYVDGQPVGGQYRDLVGAVASRGLLVVATDAGVLVLTNAGAIVDRMRGPPGLSSIGLLPDGGVVAAAETGLYRADRELLEWRPWHAAPGIVRWSETEAVAAGAAGLPTGVDAAPSLPAEHVILDLHSGRFLGPYGPYLYDLAALALLGLAGSGLALWISQRRRQRRYARAARGGASRYD